MYINVYMQIVMADCYVGMYALASNSKHFRTFELTSL